MDFVAWFIAWLDWQSDRHLDVTAAITVAWVDRKVSKEEAEWWGCHPIRTRALVGAVVESGQMQPACFTNVWGWPWWESDYDIRDLRDFANGEHCRRIAEVRWTLNRLRDRRWGIIP